MNKSKQLLGIVRRIESLGRQAQPLARIVDPPEHDLARIVKGRPASDRYLQKAWASWPYRTQACPRSSLAPPSASLEKNPLSRPPLLRPTGKLVQAPGTSSLALPHPRPRGPQETRPGPRPPSVVKKLPFPQGRQHHHTVDGAMAGLLLGLPSIALSQSFCSSSARRRPGRLRREESGGKFLAV